ncbi:MAG: 50S ribosomal protein L23 [Candidatus Levyibacteriota bacterium]
MLLTLIKPIITEGSMKDAGKGKFTFQVHKDATKTEIKREIEKAFKVNVKGISTVTIKRARVVMTKFGRKKSNDVIKKARVRLMVGQMIPAFEIKDEKKKGKKEDKGNP